MSPTQLDHLVTSHKHLLLSSSQPYSFLLSDDLFSSFHYCTFSISALCKKFLSSSLVGLNVDVCPWKWTFLSEARTAVLLVVARLNIFLTLWDQSCSTVITCVGMMSKCDHTFCLHGKSRSIFTLQCTCLGRAVSFPVAHCGIWTSLSRYPIYNYLKQKYLQQI